MKFGKHIKTVAYPPWADKYVDYKMLKKCLKPFEDGVATQAHEDGFLACVLVEINKVRVCLHLDHMWIVCVPLRTCLHCERAHQTNSTHMLSAFSAQLSKATSGLIKRRNFAGGCLLQRKGG